MNEPIKTGYTVKADGKTFHLGNTQEMLDFMQLVNKQATKIAALEAENSRLKERAVRIWNYAKDDGGLSLFETRRKLAEIRHTAFRFFYGDEVSYFELCDVPMPPNPTHERGGLDPLSADLEQARKLANELARENAEIDTGNAVLLSKIAALEAERDAARAQVDAVTTALEVLGEPVGDLSLVACVESQAALVNTWMAIADDRRRALNAALSELARLREWVGFVPQGDVSDPAYDDDNTPFPLTERVTQTEQD